MKKTITIICISLLFLSIFSCKEKVEPPSVTTKAVTEITSTSAISGGTITDDGGAPVIARGICWATTDNPDITCNKTNESNGSGSFTSNIIPLSAVTSYFVRAYATNSAGTAYGASVEFKTAFGPFPDVDGNICNIVRIGTQVWTSDNLATTKYNDGSSIPLVTDAAAWGSLTTAGYCWYENNEDANKSVYGALYNFYAVATGKLCPTGWHVPTKEEWDVLVAYLTDHGYGYEGSGDDVAKSLAFKEYWKSSTYPGSIGNDITSNNETGFSAKPAGGRSATTGSFASQGYSVGLWTSSPLPYAGAKVRVLSNILGIMLDGNSDCGFGGSVRCVSDSK